MKRQRKSSQAGGPSRSSTSAPERKSSRFRDIATATLDILRPKTPGPGPALGPSEGRSHPRSRAVSVSASTSRPSTQAGSSHQPPLPNTHARISKTGTAPNTQVNPGLSPSLSHTQPQHSQGALRGRSEPCARPPSTPPIHPSSNAGQAASPRPRTRSEHGGGSSGLHALPNQAMLSVAVPLVPSLPPHVASPLHNASGPNTMTQDAIERRGAYKLPEEVWRNIFDLYPSTHLSINELCNLTATCRVLRRYGKDFIYRGIDFFWSPDRILIQHVRGKTLPARRFAFNGPLYLEETALGNFPSGVPVGPEDHLYNRFSGLKRLTIEDSNITKWMLETIIQFDNIYDLRLKYCRISSTNTEHLSRTRRNSRSCMTLSSFTLLGLQCQFTRADSNQACDWATGETVALMRILVGSSLPSLDFEFPLIRTTAGPYFPMHQLQPSQMTSLIAAFPWDLQNLRIKSWSAVSLGGLATYLPRLPMLRALVLDGFPLVPEGGPRLESGSLPSLTHFMGPETYWEWILSGTPPLKELCLRMPGWRDHFATPQLEQDRRRERDERTTAVKSIFLKLPRLSRLIFYLPAGDDTNHYKRIVDKNFMREEGYFSTYKIDSSPPVWGTTNCPKYIRFRPFRRPGCGTHPWIYDLLSQPQQPMVILSKSDIYGRRNRNRPVRVEPLELDDP